MSAYFAAGGPAARRPPADDCDRLGLLPGRLVRIVLPVREQTIASRMATRAEPPFTWVGAEIPPPLGGRRRDAPSSRRGRVFGPG